MDLGLKGKKVFSNLRRKPRTRTRRTRAFRAGRRPMSRFSRAAPTRSPPRKRLEAMAAKVFADALDMTDLDG